MNPIQNHNSISMPRDAAAQPLYSGSPAAAFRRQPCCRRRLHALFRSIAAASAEPGALKHISRPARQQGWLRKAAAGLRAVQGAARAAAMLSLLLAPCAPLPAAPPPELTVLRTQYEKVLAEKVTAPFDAALTDLNSKFTAALDKAAADAQKAGDLPAVLAIEEDKKRIAGKLPLPDEDDEQVPASLKKLRIIYRGQFKKLDDQHTANHNAILPAYSAKLKEQEVILTKAGRVDEAKEVMVYREGLSVGAPPTAVTLARTSESAAPLGAAKTGGKHAKADPAAARKLAEWALANHHWVMIRVKGTETKIEDAQKLPASDLELVQLVSTGNTDSIAPPPWPLFGSVPALTVLQIKLGTCPVAPQDFTHLAALSNLRRLEIDVKTDDCNAIIEALPSLPDLESIGFGFVPGPNGRSLALLTSKFPHVKYPTVAKTTYTDDEFAVVANWKDCESLRLDYEACVLSAGKVGVLAKMPKLHRIDFWSSTGALLAAEDAVRLKQVTTIGLHYALHESLAAVTAIPNLTALDILVRDVTDDDLAALQNAKHLEYLKLECERFTNAVPGKIATLVPALEQFTFTNCKTLTDADIVPLASMKRLRSINLSTSPGLTDAFLDVFKKQKSLKSIVIHGTSISDKAVASFKKARPDVKVER